jgi:hypothetical protein
MVDKGRHDGQRQPCPTFPKWVMEYSMAVLMEKVAAV